MCVREGEGERDSEKLKRGEERQTWRNPNSSQVKQCLAHGHSSTTQTARLRERQRLREVNYHSKNYEIISNN